MQWGVCVGMCVCVWRGGECSYTQKKKNKGKRTMKKRNKIGKINQNERMQFRNRSN